LDARGGSNVRRHKAISPAAATSQSSFSAPHSIGFILISLFVGFAIVTALDLQAPGWLVAVVAVGAVALGIYAINVRKKTLPITSR
jgi:hypothetical protein